jgi:hypothetical protein
VTLSWKRENPIITITVILTDGKVSGKNWYDYVPGRQPRRTMPGVLGKRK